LELFAFALLANCTTYYRPSALPAIVEEGYHLKVQSFFIQ